MLQHAISLLILVSLQDTVNVLTLHACCSICVPSAYTVKVKQPYAAEIYWILSQHLYATLLLACPTCHICCLLRGSGRPLDGSQCSDVLRI
jgi:hypothetical protein